MAKHAHNCDVENAVASSIAATTHYVPRHADSDRVVEAAKAAAGEIPNPADEFELIPEDQDNSWKEIPEHDDAAECEKHGPTRIVRSGYNSGFAGEGLSWAVLECGCNLAEHGEYWDK